MSIWRTDDNCFDRMADLLIDDELLTSEPGAEVRDIARTQTLTNAGEAKQWYLDNPNAALLFMLIIVELETDVRAA